MTDAATTPVVAASMAPTNGAKQLADGVKQVFGHARAFQNQAHKGEKRDRQERVVLHDAKHAQWQALQEGGLDHA